MTGPATVESATLRQYTGRLARHLVGPRARRAEILDEVLDGLQCAVEDNLATCADPEEATRQAVRDWGTPGEVARAYNDATLRLGANRLSLRAACALPSLAVTWAIALLGSPAAPWPHHPPILVFGLSVAALGGHLCLLGAAIGLRRGRGLRAATAPHTDGTTTATLAAVTGLVVALCAPLILLLHRALPYPESLNWRLVPIPAVLTLLTGAYFVASVRRLLLVARSVAGA